MPPCPIHETGSRCVRLEELGHRDAERTRNLAEAVDGRSTRGVPDFIDRAASHSTTICEGEYVLLFRRHQTTEVARHELARWLMRPRGRHLSDVPELADRPNFRRGCLSRVSDTEAVSCIGHGGCLVYRTRRLSRVSDTRRGEWERAAAQQRSEAFSCIGHRLSRVSDTEAFSCIGHGSSSSSLMHPDEHAEAFSCIGHEAFSCIGHAGRYGPRRFAECMRRAFKRTARFCSTPTGI
jgi:hypothetical protein